MTRVLIIGCKGMAGHLVMNYLADIDDIEVFGIARNVQGEENLFSVDVTDESVFETTLAKHQYDVVINCIGLLNEVAENNPHKAIWINSYFPHWLSNLGRVYGFKVIHISTDCVFSGKQGGYTESSTKDGIGYYAQTKALGEIDNDVDLTIRTSIIGPELKKDGIGLFHWFMNQTSTINGFTKAIWSGITTLELAKAIHWAIKNDLKGLYHLTNNEPINKYDLLRLFQKHTNKDIHVNQVDGKAVNKSFVDTRRLIDYKIPSYEVMINDMVGFMNKNKNLYAHYF